eukprot:UN19382
MVLQNCRKWRLSWFQIRIHLTHEISNREENTRCISRRACRSMTMLNYWHLSRPGASPTLVPRICRHPICHWYSIGQQVAP